MYAKRQASKRDPVCAGSERNLGGELSGRRFFYFFARNPLKSPDSAKGNQRNASLFPWLSLDLLGDKSTGSCILMLDAVELPLVDRRDVAQLNGLG